MGCEESELWISYRQNSRANQPATTQLVELEFQPHKLKDLEDVLDHVVAQGWIEAHYRSVAWWEKKDGTKLKNGERIEGLLKQGIGNCESSSLKLIIADCSPYIWISYVYRKCPNDYASVQRINLLDITTANSCHNKGERLAHVANYVFKKGFLPANMRSLVHWEDACHKRIEEHACVKDVLCDRGIGKCEDKPLKLVIGLDSGFVEEYSEFETDCRPLFKITPRAPAAPPVVETCRNAVTMDDARTATTTTRTQESGFDSKKRSSSVLVLPPSHCQELSSPRFPSSTPPTPIQTLALTSSCSSSTPSEDILPIWTIHYMLFGVLFSLILTAAVNRRALCEHCRVL